MLNRRFLLAAALASLTFTGGAANAQVLPPEVETALARARMPLDAVSFLVVDADGRAAPRLSHRVNAPVNPASVAKLATTFAALDLLGPAFTWTTPVYIDGPVQDGVLQGNLYIKGQGDPKLVAERLWLLMRRVQGLGIRQIAGDIILDRTAFDVPPQDPGAFDGEPLRPYNASPDALLLNFKSVVMTFTPVGAQAQIHVEPPLAGVQFPSSLPLRPGTCGDWRPGLQADFSNPARVSFAGAYPASCGEREWPVAYVDPPNYAARAVGGMWQQLGGALKGQVRDGRVPAALAPALELRSPPHTEIVRDINKYSNNVMAQQLFLTLAAQQRTPATFDAARDVLQQWWRSRIGGDGTPVFGNGSGLSRDELITAQQLARLLQVAWASPLMPELASSLPIWGVDGTLRRARGKGIAHLKTGSLRDSAGLAGFVDGPGGRRWVVVAIANHAQASAARPAIDALVEWASRQP
jgi:D-alanyl-D-alanine carboxypeptidase/D-alanyl-D-alanine-endopeptidase (penicillin-binding protein 4)